MAWNSNNGGGGPWKPNPKSPWGQGPAGGGGAGPGGQQPPDLEDLLRRGQDKLRQVMPGAGMGFTSFAFLALAAAAIWAASGFFTVQPNEMALKTVFGRYTDKVGSGLNYNWPYPVGSVIKLPVTDRKTTNVGFVTRTDPRTLNQQTIDVAEESLMLTDDDNQTYSIADVKFVVIWQIRPSEPEAYAFNVRRQELTIKAVAESAMREVVGRTLLKKLLTAERKTIEPAVQKLMQDVLDEYKAGVDIIQVQLQSVDPPEQVIAAFRDVTAAQQDQERLRNEAMAYANRVVPEARGEAAAILQKAEGYREQTVAEARGQTSRFNQVFEEYRKAPGVTRERLYLETMERVFGGMNKVILDQAGNPQGVVPYLPLGAIESPPAPSPSQPAPRAPAQGAAR